MRILCGFTEYHSILEKWRKMFNADTWIMPEIMTHEHPDFAIYDVVYLYFLNEKLSFWIKTVRELAPKTKILVTLDSGWWYVLTPWLKTVSLSKKEKVLNNLAFADGFFVLNWHFKNFLKQQFPKKHIFFHLFYPRDLPHIQPISFERRLEERKAVIMFHSMANMKIDTQLEVAKRLGLKAVVIGTFQNMNILRHNARKYNNVELHERFKKTEDYFSKLNECLVGIEDYYDGGSRFTVECANVGVPVIGTRTAWSLNYFMPELACEPMDVNCMVQKTEKLISDRDYYNKISKRIRADVRRYCSYDETKKRLLQFMRKVLRDGKVSKV